RDGRFDATPLCYATVGSGERAGHDGDWVGVVRILLAAGASPLDVWIEDKPPSDALALELAEHGITAPDVEPPATPDPAVLRALADRLLAAMTATDFAAFGELLGPDVRWGNCTRREQVLNHYRRSYDTGVRIEVLGSGIDGDTILVDLVRHADGLSEPMQQAFRVAGGVIVFIEEGGRVPAR
ncbi:MAG TPA: hypothetical protein VF892_06875, partial [Pseudonocardiaceae bacterium]